MDDKDNVFQNNPPPKNEVNEVNSSIKSIKIDRTYLEKPPSNSNDSGNEESVAQFIKRMQSSSFQDAIYKMHKKEAEWFRKKAEKRLWELENHSEYLTVKKKSRW